MAESAAVAQTEPVSDEPQQDAKQKSQENTKRKRQPPYAVILHNDDVNTFDHVVNVLRKVFRYEQPKAVLLTNEAHKTGRSIVWSGVLEVAELKADQIRSCGADPERKAEGALSLRVSVEPLPQ
jgi:ATP-dependent Clp protease adaptor protein ClpS